MNGRDSCYVLTPYEGQVLCAVDCNDLYIYNERLEFRLGIVQL